MKTKEKNTTQNTYQLLSANMASLPKDKRFLKYTFGLGFCLALSYSR